MGLPPAVDDATEGLATLDAILAIEPSTKVIMVSGNEDRANAAAAIDRGAADFYAKPIDEDILSIIIRACVSCLRPRVRKSPAQGRSEPQLSWHHRLHVRR